MENNSLTRRSFLKGSVLSILGVTTVTGVSKAEGGKPNSSRHIERGIVFTDLHIGWEKSNIKKLLELWDGIVNENENKEIIFLGDVFDLWRNKKLEGSPHDEFLKKLSVFQKNGGRIAYVVGNHDYHLVKILEGDRDDPNDLGKRLKECGVDFYHPFFQFKSGDNIFIATHGDNYDFLYWFVVLELTSQPSIIYEEFYEGVYRNNEISKKWDQGDIPGAVYEWFKKRFRWTPFKGMEQERMQQRWEELDNLEKLMKYREKMGISKMPLKEEIAPVPMAKFPIEVASDYQELLHKMDLDLRKVHNKKLSESLDWKDSDKRLKFYHPFPQNVDSGYFSRTPDCVLIGHFHDPRLFAHWNNLKLIRISDVGAGVERILTYATIKNGEFSLHWV